MRLGILSDIHDNLWNLQPAIAYLNANADVLLCCGDLCSPFVMDELRKFNGPVHIVFGNNDADLFRITRKSDERLQVYGEFFEQELGGRRIAANHFDYIARPIARSGAYDLVCFGHNHRISLERFGRTTVINPGPIMGAAFRPGGWENVASTFAICETTSLEIRAFQVVGARSVEPFELTARPESALQA
jgi:putative phosphoesterase